MDNEKFGMYIANIRKQNGLTQLELAKEIHVTDKAISKWERGIGLPDINNILPLANALGISVSDLMRAGENQVDANEDEAVKNTLTLAKNKKRKLFQKELSILLIYIGLKAVAAIYSNSNPSSYNNLPMMIVYMLLFIYIIFTIGLTIYAFKKDKGI